MIPRPNLRLWPRSGTNAVWTLADSAASSGSNFALGSLVAIRSTPELYGRFALAFALYGLTFGVWRAWATEPFLLGMRNRSNSVGSVVGACGLIGGVVMVLGLVIGGGVGDAGRSLVLVVAVSLPVLAAHDGVRYCLIGSKRAHLALTIDVTWLVLMLTGSTRISGPAPLILWWSVSGALTLVLGLHLLKWPSLTGGFSWLRRTTSVGMRFISEFMVITGSNSAVMFSVGYSSDLTEMGAYRGAAVLVGPVAIVMNGLVTVVLTMSTHTMAGENGGPGASVNFARVRSHVQRLTVLSLLVGVGWSVAVLAVPSNIGENILGETWEASHRAAVPLALAVGGQAAILVSTAGYRLLGQINKGARLKTIAMVMVMVGGSSASFYDGAFGAATGFAGVSTIAGVTILVLFRRDAATPTGPCLNRVAVDVGLSFNETDPLI